MDGRTGQTLWDFQTTQPVMASDLVTVTTGKNRDAFIFNVQGRLGGKDTHRDVGSKLMILYIVEVL